MNQDPLILLIHNMSDRLDEIKEDTKTIKEQCSDLRVSQAKCDSNWNIVKSVSGWGGIGTVMAWVWSKVTGN